MAFDSDMKDLVMAKSPKGKNSKGQQMWGGRFSASPGELMQAINVSIDFDKRLAAQDIRGSKAHSAMLAAQGIITKKDMRAIHKGLTEIEKEIENGTFPWSRDLEDIHLNIESRLKDKIGDAAGRLIRAVRVMTKSRQISAFGYVTTLTNLTPSSKSYKAPSSPKRLRTRTLSCLVLPICKARNL